MLQESGHAVKSHHCFNPTNILFISLKASAFVCQLVFYTRAETRWCLTQFLLLLFFSMWTKWARATPWYNSDFSYQGMALFSTTGFIKQHNLQWLWFKAANFKCSDLPLQQTRTVFCLCKFTGQRYRSCLFKDEVTKVTTINICCWCYWLLHRWVHLPWKWRMEDWMEGWQNPQGLTDSVYMTFSPCGTNRQNGPPSSMMRSGPTACHVVLFLCLCFNFIWTKVQHFVPLHLFCDTLFLFCLSAIWIPSMAFVIFT